MAMQEKLVELRALAAECKIAAGWLDRRKAHQSEELGREVCPHDVIEDAGDLLAQTADLLESLYKGTITGFRPVPAVARMGLSGDPNAVSHAVLNADCPKCNKIAIARVYPIPETEESGKTIVDFYFFCFSCDHGWFLAHGFKL